MPTFVGPVEFTRSPVDADPAACARNPLGNRLMRFYGAQSRGVNVFIMRDGTVTKSDPTDWSLVAHALWGAHVEYVTDAEAALLTAAGYGVYLATSGYSDIYTDVYSAASGYSHTYTDVYS